MGCCNWWHQLIGGNIGVGDTAPGEALSVTGNIALTGIVDGRDVAVDGIKLDGMKQVLMLVVG